MSIINSYQSDYTYWDLKVTLTVDRENYSQCLLSPFLWYSQRAVTTGVTIVLFEERTPQLLLSLRVSLKS